MRRTAIGLTLTLVLASCGGGAAAPDTSAATSSTTITSMAASCPHGVLSGSGDGPDYLAFQTAFAAAESGELLEGRPRLLGPAAEGIPQDLMVGLRYLGCSSIDGDVVYEEMAWSNGIGLMLITWHEWPHVQDPSGMPFGGEAAQAGVVQVSTAAAGQEGARLRVVRLFDGLKIVAVTTFGLSTMSIEQVEQVAWAVYDGLPIDLDGAEAGGMTVPEVLEMVRSDQVTVSDPEPVAELAPFTRQLGAAPASYSAVIDGTGVRLFDFGLPAVAERMASMISSDGYTVAHMPYEWEGQPHFWLVDRVIVLYQGSHDSFVELLTEVLGPPLAPSPAESAGDE